jgi:hypothetical protein
MLFLERYLHSTGGAVSGPVNQDGFSFARVALFEKFPYALPTIIAGTVGAIATLVSVFFITEVVKLPS